MQLPVIAMLTVLLGIVAYQDFKDRAISAWLLLTFLILSFWLGSYQLRISELLLNGLINLGFISLQLALISIYFSIRNGYLVNIADRYIGWGDILFFIPLATLFSTSYFILFYVLALMVSLVGFLIYKQLIHRQVATIPLAGLMAFCLVGVLLCSWWWRVDLYATQLIYSLKTN